MEPKTEPANGSEAAVKREQETELKGTDGDATMTEYERKRLANIERNIEYMKSVGVSTAKMAARTSVGRPKSSKVSIKRVIPMKQPARKSRRLRGQEAPTKETPMVYVPLHERKRMEEEHKLKQWAVNRKRFDANLYANVPDEQRQRILAYMASEEQESDLAVDANGLDDVQEYELVRSGIVNPTKKRICSIAFYPRDDKVVVASGDQQGKLVLWSPDKASKDPTDSVTMFKAHKSFITQLCFNPNDDSKLISSSFDGSVREFDTQAAAFTELYSGDSSITSLALVNPSESYLVSCEDGSVVTLDQRSPKTKQSIYQLHEKKINNVHVHPLQTHCIATASYDRTVKLWDLRQMKKTDATPIATMPHYRNVTCAYFSPKGAHLLTVGLDDFLHIYDTDMITFSDPKKVVPTLVIPHSNHTGLDVIKLRAAWDPKHMTRFVVGSLQKPRRLQIFDATRKNPVQELHSELFDSVLTMHSVHSINVFHPKLSLIAGGNGSGSLCIWRPVQK